MKPAPPQFDVSARRLKTANLRAGLNPPCPACGGPSKKNSFTQGKQRYKCKAGCGSFLARYHEPKRYPCPTCGGPSRKFGYAPKKTQHRKQRYQCRGSCRRSWLESYDHEPAAYPWCVTCRAPMTKAGKSRGRGFQTYQCRRCRAYCKDGPPLHKIPIRARRRLLASLRWEETLDAIQRAVPTGLPPDVREEVIQEMALAALEGEIKLGDIARAVAFYRRKVSRQMADRFKFVSIDQPDADGLTYADRLAG